MDYYEQWKYWIKFWLPKEIIAEIVEEGLPHPSIVPTDKIK